MIVVDRRAAIAAIAAPLFVRHARAADVARFGLGIASGEPAPDGVVLWTRLQGDDLADAVDVAWEVADDAGFTRIAARGVDVARAADAHTVHAEVRGLGADRWYWYRFSALGQRSAAGRTRTAPAPGARVAALQFALASCQRWDHGHWAAWRHAAAEGLDLVLFVGDYIYEYAPGRGSLRAHHATPHGGPLATLDDYRARYAQYRSDAALQAAHAAAPWLVTWDDHEVENDYAGAQGNRLQPTFAQQRAAAYRAWWEHMPLPHAMRPRPDASVPVHRRLDWGDLARLQILDNRQWRDPQACPLPGRGGSGTVRGADCAALREPQRTLLGSAQEAWLAEGWSTDRPWNLLVQQTLMAPCNRAPATEGGLWWTDGWDGYPAARARLLRTVAERRVPGAVVLGGDVHAAVVANLHADADDPRSPVIASEFCGTSISSNGGAQQRWTQAVRDNPHLLHARSDQRGYARFTLGRDALQATLRVVDDGRDPECGMTTQGRFVVDAKRAGVVAA